jgi:hypothetical protein
MTQNAERRKFPRIEDNELSVRLNLADYDSVTHTLNLSTSGIYCKVDKQMPLMSKVRLMLMVPDSSGKEKETHNLKIDGVIVREHPVIINGEVRHYDCAIFFENLSARDTEIISAYISNRNK